MAFAYHRLLDLQRGVFGYNEVIQDSRANRSAARLSQHERGFRIDVDESCSTGYLVRTMFRDHLVQVVHDGFQAQRQLAIHGLDAAAADVCKLAAVDFDDPEAGDAQSGIYAKDTDFPALLVFPIFPVSGFLQKLFIDYSSSVNLLHVVDVFQRIEQFLHFCRFVSAQRRLAGGFIVTSPISALKPALSSAVLISTNSFGAVITSMPCHRW